MQQALALRQNEAVAVDEDVGPMSSFVCMRAIQAHNVRRGAKRHVPIQKLYACDPIHGSNVYQCGIVVAVALL